MNPLVSKIVLLTSVALATCIIAETAYPQDYRNPPKTDLLSEMAPLMSSQWIVGTSQRTRTTCARATE